MNKRVFLLLLITFTFIFISGCGSSFQPAATSVESYKAEPLTFEGQKTVFNANKMMDYNNPDYSVGEYNFSVVPAFYMQDYAHTFYNGRTIAECGNPIVAMAMIDSYVNKEWIEPDGFLTKYSNETANGSCDIEAIGNRIMENHGFFAKKDFDYEQLCYYLSQQAIAVIHIKHPSMYGSDASYIVITKISDSELFTVRDPNYEILQKYCAAYTENDEPQYYIADILTAAGRDAEMYIFWGDFSYEN